MSELDILVPVLGRPQNVRPLLDSIAEATSLQYKVFFIATQGDKDEIAELRKQKATFWIHPEPAGRANFAKKINWAFPKTKAPWVFQAADDLKFHWGWDIYALRMAGKREARVVGTNDMGNKLVMRGGHSTHTLIHRTYITEHGGTVDNSGLVFCELYDHQYCDNEFVQTAIRRGEWAFSKRSLVEHLHPAWKKGEMDDTYTKAFRETDKDGRLYLKRVKLSAGERRAARRLELHETRLDRQRRRSQR